MRRSVNANIKKLALFTGLVNGKDFANSANTNKMGSCVISED